PEHPPAAHAHAAAAKHAAKGVFRIQVATAQSRDAANGVVQSLQGKGELLASAHVTVDEAKFGATTFFRVRLGPYATAADTKAPCEALKAAGLDCLVTAR
ncbi:MAG: SPOR domain-containing protein, partial [Gammaproteobacteria bacterium]